MMFHPMESINVLLAVALLWSMTRQDTLGILTCFFAYASGYFLFSLVPLFMGQSSEALHLMHFDSDRPMVKAATALFLLVGLSLLSWRTRKVVLKDSRFSALSAVCMFFVAAGFMLNFRNGDGLQIQHLLALEFMMLIAWLGCAGLRLDGSNSLVTSRRLYLLNTGLLASTAIAFYEVYSHRAWAHTIISDDIFWRASSFLFNPNLYGTWSALIFLGLACVWHQGRRELQKPALVGIMLLSAGLYLSSARSATWLLIICLCLAMLLVRGFSLWRRALPLLMMVCVFCLMALISGLLANTQLDPSEGWRSIALLGERNLFAPYDLLSHFFGHSVAPEVAVSIEGRFAGEEVDSGILMLVRDAGWVGTFALLAWVASIFIRVVKTYIMRLDAVTAYAIVALIYCAGVGIFMRYQVFPVWLFVAVVLAFCASLSLKRTTDAT